MEPIFNQQFSDDARRFVYQEPEVITINYLATPIKKFTLEAPKKSKKDMKKEMNKEKSPWIAKQNNDNEKE